MISFLGMTPTRNPRTGTWAGSTARCGSPANRIRTRSLSTSNSKENLAAVESIIKQLDQPSEAGESTLHCSLKFAKSATVANSINILFAKNGSPPLRATGQANPQNPQANNPAQTSTTQDTTSSQPGFDLPQATKEDGYYPWLGGQPDPSQSSGGRSTSTVRPVSDLVGRVRAVADERSNSLLISANVHFFPQIMKLIDELDAPTDQVLIEARLVSVSSDFMDKLGVRWAPNGTAFTAQDNDNSFLAAGNGSYQKGFGGSTVVNGSSSGSTASSLSPANLMTSLRSGVVDNTISLDFLVQFLKETTKATVLAEPQLNIRDNETGRLFVGQEVPVPDNSLNSSVGTTTSTYKYKNVGIVLEVTPHINTAGDVELMIHVESSSLVSGQTVNNGSVFDTDNFRTDLTAKNGQTLVLGGIIQKQISNTLRKTPLLGSIPGVKWLVNKKDADNSEVELMVFLRPHVVSNPADAAAVLRGWKSARRWSSSGRMTRPRRRSETTADPLPPSSGGGRGCARAGHGPGARQGSAGRDSPPQHAPCHAICHDICRLDTPAVNRQRGHPPRICGAAGAAGVPGRRPIRFHKDLSWTNRPKFS